MRLIFAAMRQMLYTLLRTAVTGVSLGVLALSCSDLLAGQEDSGENRGMLQWNFASAPLIEAMTRAQIMEVERIANQKIMENHPVTYRETSLKAAREAGVIALFGEKYGDIVRSGKTRRPAPCSLAASSMPACA